MARGGETMNRIKLLPALLFALACILAMPSSAALGDRARGEPGPRPSTSLKPDDVVRIVIGALARNDEPYADAGIETTYRFAAPSNKLNTGPLDRFTRMVKGSTYGIMVDHASSEFSEVVVTGDKAYQLVRLTGSSGLTVVFAFRLGKQAEGEYENMWMTEAVWPVAVGDQPGQAF